jgi:hypothetical protein
MPKILPLVFPRKSIPTKKEYLLPQIPSKEWLKKMESTSLSKVEQDSKLQSPIKPTSIQELKSFQQKKRSPQMLSSKSECLNSTKKSMKSRSTLSNKVQLLFRSFNQVKIKRLYKKLNKEESPHLPWIKSQEQPEHKLLMLYRQWPTSLDTKQSS